MSPGKHRGQLADSAAPFAMALLMWAWCWTADAASAGPANRLTKAEQASLVKLAKHLHEAASDAEAAAVRGAGVGEVAAPLRALKAEWNAHTASDLEKSALESCVALADDVIAWTVNARASKPSNTQAVHFEKWISRDRTACQHALQHPGSAFRAALEVQPGAVIE